MLGSFAEFERIAIKERIRSSRIAKEEYLRKKIAVRKKVNRDSKLIKCKKCKNMVIYCIVINIKINKKTRSV
jgi:DNA invertase Pin-like site-specific DNA recombinase